MLEVWVSLNIATIKSPTVTRVMASGELPPLFEVGAAASEMMLAMACGRPQLAAMATTMATATATAIH
jgi:hypothetical protein